MPIDKQQSVNNLASYLTDLTQLPLQMHPFKGIPCLELLYKNASLRIRTDEKHPNP